MELSKIMSISGKPGLFKHVAQSKTSIVVESILDGKRTTAFPSEQISTLGDISIYTENDDVKLEDVFKKIFEKENGKKTPDFKISDNELKKYFENILPEYDKERVYISDIKKVIKWYNLLIDHNLLEFKEEVTNKVSENQEKESEEEKSEKQDASKKGVKEKKTNETKKTSEKVKPSTKKTKDETKSK
jgi:hypothetical protein